MARVRPERCCREMKGNRQTSRGLDFFQLRPTPRRRRPSLLRHRFDAMLPRGVNLLICDLSASVTSRLVCLSTTTLKNSPNAIGGIRVTKTRRRGRTFPPTTTSRTPHPTPPHPPKKKRKEKRKKEKKTKVHLSLDRLRTLKLSWNSETLYSD